MRFFWSVLWIVIVFFGPLRESSGAGLADFREQKELTPGELMRQLAGFAFELRDEVQEPERFLERRRGDCDDFARVAALLLTERGYHTKIVAVMMERETHVVCFVAEIGGYLDFNHRAAKQPVVRSAAGLEEIAGLVAGEFHSKWRMASEVRFEKARPVFLSSVFYCAPTTTTTTTPAAAVRSGGKESAGTTPIRAGVVRKDPIVQGASYVTRRSAS